MVLPSDPTWAAPIEPCWSFLVQSPSTRCTRCPKEWECSRILLFMINIGKCIKFTLKALPSLITFLATSLVMFDSLVRRLMMFLWAEIESLSVCSTVWDIIYQSGSGNAWSEDPWSFSWWRLPTLWQLDSSPARHTAHLLLPSLFHKSHLAQKD